MDGGGAGAVGERVQEILYFAFGSNMVTAQMAARCTGAEFLGVAVLADHRFRIGRRGYGTVVQEPGAAVYGVLWGLREEDEAALDVYEGVRHGLYQKAWRTVRTGAGDDRQALVYVATDPTPGAAVPGYVEKMVTAAEEHGLPQVYREELRGWLP